MEPLSLVQRTSVETPDVENWDDDDFDNLEDVQFRTASTSHFNYLPSPSRSQRLRVVAYVNEIRVESRR